MSLTLFDAPAADPGTGLQRLFAVPHRAYFGAGVIAILSLALWWAVAIAQPLVGSYPALQVHGLLTPLGVFPLFMLGFIFTAGPRWLNVSDPGQASHHLPLALLYLLGLWLALAGFSYGGRWPTTGLLLMQISWTFATLRWLRIYQLSTVPDKRHALRILIAMTVGAMALMVAVLWVQSGDGLLWWFARQLTFWGLLLPVFVTVSHRMVPFFTQSALPSHTSWRPNWLLDTWLAGCAVLIVADALGQNFIASSAALALAASLGFTSWRWGLVASLQNRLLAMLHLSFAWLAPALLLQGLQSAGVSVGAAPAHALGLGFCCTMLVGFVTRVTLGHGGRDLVADNGYWAIYLGLHGIALLRVGLALFGGPAAYLHLASAGWLLLMLIWAARVLPIYWQPRFDGKPG
ncbi:NnrS family protein [Chitinimonas sp. PSY-7]|uniref:NnrS family protein n=1 Tax=Chitinimonas sp. PSY-7 TaxID=3459088 RepID=UPI0040400136